MFCPTNCLIFTTKFRFLLLNLAANRIFVKATVGTDFIIGAWSINNIRQVNAWAPNQNIKIPTTTKSDGG